MPLPKSITAKPGRNKLICSAGERRKAEQVSEVMGFWLLQSSSYREILQAMKKED